MDTVWTVFSFQVNNLIDAAHYVQLMIFLQYCLIVHKEAVIIFYYFVDKLLGLSDGACGWLERFYERWVSWAEK